MIVEQRLRERSSPGALAPVHLEVVNESGQHNVPAGSETHFKVVVVSGAFAGKPRVAQHRMVFRAVDDELRRGVHALAVHTYTEDAWAGTGAARPRVAEVSRRQGAGDGLSRRPVTTCESLDAVFSRRGSLVLLLAAVRGVRGRDRTQAPPIPGTTVRSCSTTGSRRSSCPTRTPTRPRRRSTSTPGAPNDPEDRPGLAHFLEHMLFLGTEKYPDPGEYGRFISEHGGASKRHHSRSPTRTTSSMSTPGTSKARSTASPSSSSLPRGSTASTSSCEREVVHSEYISLAPQRSASAVFAAWRQALDPRHPLSGVPRRQRVDARRPPRLRHPATS